MRPIILSSLITSAHGKLPSSSLVTLCDQTLPSFSKQFPSEPLHVLTDHGDEVWYLKFSHNGTRLASGARDGQIIIWSLAVSRLICVLFSWAFISPVVASLH